jgi:3-phenylpropionate/trans-cinnamate dioxygenase ferredoxin reductase subunit
MNTRRVIVVGAGQAGFQICASLREKGFDGSIVLIGDESSLPYERPPLSKQFLAGDGATDSMLFRPVAFYTDNAIDVILGDSATEIDRASQSVRLGSGHSVQYDWLVLAQGARNRSMPLPGAWAADALSLRTLDNAERLKKRIAGVETVVVIGAGFVGLEVAATLAKKKVAVEILDVMPRVMSRAVSGPISDFFQRAHLDWGSKLHCGAAVHRIDTLSDGRHLLHASDGSQIETNLIVVGIGVIPNVELAFEAGLRIDNGIVVDASLRTSDETIFAIGDCATFPSDDGMMRLESVQNAVDQARCVAEQIMGATERYSSVPWFWSEQNGLKLQIAGVTKGHTHIAIRGNPEQGQFSVFCFDGTRLLGIESVNRPADHIIGRRLLGKSVRVTPQQASDSSLDLRTLLNQGVGLQASVA